MRNFSAKALRYMLAYSLFDSHISPENFKSQDLSYKEIERFVDKEMQVHQSALNQDHGYISTTWRNAQRSQNSST